LPHESRTASANGRIGPGGPGLAAVGENANSGPARGGVTGTPGPRDGTIDSALSARQDGFSPADEVDVENTISTRGLTKRHRSTPAVDALSFDVRPDTGRPLVAQW
jgi:hypothetical protein